MIKAAKIRELRKEKKLTQCALAEMAGLKQGSLSDIESGKQSPSLCALIRIAKALGCTLDDLVDMSADPAAS